MDPYLFKRLIRKPWLTLCTVLISVVLCLLIGYLSQYKQLQLKKLDETRQAYDVMCIVTDKKGTKSTSLKMNGNYLKFVTEESKLQNHIKDLRITKEFAYSSPENGIFPIIEDYDHTPFIGVSSERCVDILNPEMAGEVTYFADDFYESQERICLVSEVFYSSLKGDTIVLNLTDPAIDRMKNPELGRVEELEFKIAGYYSGSGYTLYMPFGTAISLCDLISKSRSVDSISFIAADNLKLDSIPSDAIEYFGAVDPLNGAYGQYAINIQDDQYRSAVSILEQNIGRINLLLPVIMVLSLGVGFLVSFLSTRNETKTYALMRTLGMNKVKLFMSVIREQLVTVITAAVLSLAAIGSPLPIAIYLVCYLVGVCACTVKTVGVSPTAILKEQE